MIDTTVGILAVLRCPLVVLRVEKVFFPNTLFSCQSQAPVPVMVCRDLALLVSTIGGWCQ